MIVKNVQIMQGWIKMTQGSIKMIQGSINLNIELYE